MAIVFFVPTNPFIFRQFLNPLALKVKALALRNQIRFQFQAKRILQFLIISDPNRVQKTIIQPFKVVLNILKWLRIPVVVAALSLLLTMIMHRHQSALAFTIGVMGGRLIPPLPSMLLWAGT